MVLLGFAPVAMATGLLRGTGLWLVPAAWAWLCGGNYLLSNLRFHGFFQRAMEQATRRPAPAVVPPWAPGQPPRFPRG